MYPSSLLVTVALVASLPQALAQGGGGIPQCAQSCVGNSIQNAGCGPTDIKSVQSSSPALQTAQSNPNSLLIDASVLTRTSSMTSLAVLLANAVPPTNKVHFPFFLLGICSSHWLTHYLSPRHRGLRQPNLQSWWYHYPPSNRLLLFHISASNFLFQSPSSRRRRHDETVCGSQRCFL